MTDDHADLHEWAGAFAAGALDRDERARFEAHLRTCPTCQATVADLLPVVGALGRLGPADIEPLPPAPTAIADAAAARAVADQSRLARSRSRWRTVAVAAVLLAAVALAALALRRPDRGPSGTEVALTGRATGTVELIERAWGTQLELTIGGLPTTGTFQAVVVDADGQRQPAATWGATPAGRAAVGGATSVRRASLVTLEITGPEGQVLATADL